MISKADPSFFRSVAGVGLAALLFSLAGCSDPVPDLTPIERAERALANGDGLGAEIILRDMLASGTPRQEIAAFLGQAELQQDETPEARHWLEAGEFSDESRGHGFHMLGRLELIERNLAQAGKAFDRALDFMPDNPELWVDIGRLRYLGGEQEQAVEASIHAVELDPENATALQFRAQLVRDADGMAAALPWYEAALERNPDNLLLMGDYAATLGEFGRAKDMLVVVRRMMELDEHNTRGFFLQAVLAARGGDFALARQLLARSGDLEREAPAAMMLSAIIDMEKGNYASASQMLDKLERLQPDNARIRLLVARSLSLGNNHRELVYRFKDRAIIPGSSPYLATLVGRSYEVLNEREKAAPFLDFAAQTLNNDLRPIRTTTRLDVAAIRGSETGRDAVALVRGLMSAGRSAAAIKGAEAFLRRAPGSADALGLAGDAYLAAGQGKRAADYYARAASIRQSWPLTRRMYAAELNAGRKRSAMTLLENELIGHSANIEAAILLAEAELMEGDAIKAAVLLDLAIANGGGRSPKALILRAKAALQLDDPVTAREAAMRAYSLQRMNLAATETLADVLVVTDGETPQTRELAVKAAKLGAS